ncbi:MAG: lipid-A-disaccharide synthase, partial [Perlucidibaca sp.]
MTARGPVFGIVAGEVSGDTLGAGLIRALRQHYPDARFIGIAGPQMLAEGAETLVPMERLSVMGLVEVLGRIRELFQVRDQLIARLQDERIDAFIGIDAPDFNLRIAARLKQAGIPTVHYVSPSVWAWRQGRVKGIRASVDLMLCLLPFEKAFYDKHGVRAVFVGHPLADSLPLQPETAQARAQLALLPEDHCVALLPGSRRGEVASLLPLLLETAERLQRQLPGLRFLIPAINQDRRQEIEALLAAHETAQA